MNEQDTTAVLSPISGQADETETSSQSAPALTGTGLPGGQAKAAPEKKRSGRIPEPKRFKIFCGSSNRALAEEICKFVGVPLGETRLQRFSDGEVHFQRDPVAEILRRRGSLSTARERSRCGCISRAAYVFPGRSAPG